MPSTAVPSVIERQRESLRALDEIDALLMRRR